jgi:hypothetical protein
MIYFVVIGLELVVYNFDGIVIDFLKNHILKNII